MTGAASRGQASSGAPVGGTDIASLRRAVRQARAALRATRLRAPASGTIAQVDGKAGDATGTSPFTTIVNPHLYTVAVSVGEKDIASIRKGRRATVAVDAVTGLRLSGHVTSVGAVADSDGSTVTYPVTVSLDEPTARARARRSSR